MAKIIPHKWECVCLRTPYIRPRHGKAKMTADQPKNHRKTIAHVRAICASVMKKPCIMASL